VVAWNYPNQCYGDSDNDSQVLMNDFFAFVDAFGTSAATDYNDGAGPYDPAADFDQNGLVQMSDFFTFVDYFKKSLAGDCVTVQGYPNPWTW
jgi:hypothetical protein